jgi:hypothetical protein
VKTDELLAHQLGRAVDVHWPDRVGLRVRRLRRVVHVRRRREQEPSWLRLKQSVEQILRAGHVDGHGLRGMCHAVGDEVDRGQVDHAPWSGAVNGAPDCIGVAKIDFEDGARHVPERSLEELAGSDAEVVEGNDVEASLQEVPRYRYADEAGRAGDQHALALHGCHAHLTRRQPRLLRHGSASSSGQERIVPVRVISGPIVLAPRLLEAVPTALTDPEVDQHAAPLVIRGAYRVKAVVRTGGHLKY